MLEDKGLSPIEWSMISLSLSKNAKFPIKELEQRYDAIVLTSPVAVRMFFSAWEGDCRSLPEIWTCGAGTDAELRKYGVCSDLMPQSNFSAKGLIAQMKQERSRLKGKKVLRLRSSKASRSVAIAMRRMGAAVDDVVLYENVQVSRDGIPLPKFDAVFFASSSAVQAFIDQYGIKVLSGKQIFIIGEPTRNALPLRLQAKAQLLPLATRIYE
jgi:uroporphyrinogen III methyltransferase/synthase